jgi:copper chaperone CopZ
MNLFKILVFCFASLLLSATSIADVKVSVGDMTCESCANTIKKGFAKVTEVESCEVDVDKGLVTLKEKANKKVSDETIKKTIEHYGYTLKGIKREG